jgi:hypothetical protein
VQVTGEWANVQKAGGSDAIIPVTLTDEWTAPMSTPASTVSAVLAPGAGGWTATLAMPPRPLNMTNPQRKLSVDLRQATADGKSVQLLGVSDMKLPFRTRFVGAQPIPVEVEQVGEQLRVTVRIAN